jgi:hypothetical protein
MAVAVRSPMASRSHWLTLARTFNTRRPAALRVSICSPTREQRRALREVALHEGAEVANGAGEPIQLHHEQRVGFVGIEHPQGAREARAIQALRALARVDNHGHEIQLEKRGVRLHLGALRVQGNALVGLLVRAHPEIRNGAGAGGSDGGRGASRASHVLLIQSPMVTVNLHRLQNVTAGTRRNSLDSKWVDEIPTDRINASRPAPPAPTPTRRHQAKKTAGRPPLTRLVDHCERSALAVSRERRVSSPP